MKKYFTIAIRFLLKHKNYTLINVGGLAFSMVAILFIALYVFDELSFDRFHSKADRIYRVIEHRTNDKGEESDMAGVAFLTAQTDEKIPSVEQYFRMTVLGRINVWTTHDNMFYESTVYADQGLLDIFDFELIDGNRSDALVKPYTLILTRATAIKIFGTDKAAGKELYTDLSEQPFTVTGVLEDFPSNSHLNQNIFFSMESNVNLDWYKRFSASDWSSNYFSTYYLLKQGANPIDAATTLTNLVKENRGSEAQPFHFWLQPLTDIHFHSSSIRGGFSSQSGEIYYVYIFGAVGLFILVIALVNYVNLSTSLAITRGKEIGIKKVAGAVRSQLIGQFISEATLVVLVAAIIALAVGNVLLPSFNDFTQKTIASDIFTSSNVLVSLVLFVLATGLLAGSYPAFFLSRLKPVAALKGYGKPTSSSSVMRRGLVVFQFFLSITLIIATLTAYRQIEYVRTKSLGFNQNQLVVLDINSGLVRRNFQTIKNELAQIPGATHVSVSSRIPGEWKNLAQVRTITSTDPVGSFNYFIGADEDFLNTFEIQLMQGRNFQTDFPADSSSVLLNETAARLMNVEVGDELTVPSVNMAVSENPLDAPFRARVIGIIQDFHFQSLHQKIAPLMIGYRNNPVQSIDYFTMRLNTNDLEKSLEAMQAALHKVDNSHLLEYNFLDQRLSDFYKADEKRSALFTMAAVVAVALACLGLFSLASFNTALRTKEIGVRKVLGASVSQITVLLSKDYLKLVALGFVLAAPFSWWALQGWLASFAYRIEIGWLILAVACIISLLIALLTVGYKSVMAAIANPIHSLRSE